MMKLKCFYCHKKWVISDDSQYSKNLDDNNPGKIICQSCKKEMYKH